MPAPQRRFTTDLIQQLLDEPFRFEFFQAVRIIETWLRRHGRETRERALSYLCFHNSLSMAFPPSQIEDLRAVADVPVTTSEHLLRALQDRTLRRISITPAFMGLTGVSGGLPLHYTERIGRHSHQRKDESAIAFLDLLSSRPFMLFYESLGRYRIDYLADVAGEDEFLPMLLALAGLEPSSVRPGAVPDEAIGAYAAQCRTRRSSVHVVEATLAAYFCVPVLLEPLIGCWVPIPPAAQTILGKQNIRLGDDAMLGERHYRHDLRMRLRIGPLPRARFDRFVPGGPDTRALEQWLRILVPEPLVFEVRVSLRAEDIQPTVLDSNSPPRLGYGTFLAPRDQAAHREAMIFELRP